MSKLPIKQKAISALSLCIGAIVLCLGIAVAPYLYDQKLATQLEYQSVQIRNLKNTSGKILSGLKKQNEVIKELGNQKTFLLEGSTTGIAGANLQKRVSEVVRRHKGQSRSFQVLPPEAENSLVRISLNISLQADINRLQKILHELEISTPFVFVENILINTETGPSGNAAAFQRKILDVTMRVSGYVSNEGNI